jgi:hypothetical protein
MRTIGRASETTSGKATELLPLEGKSLPIECPIKLPDMLSGKNYCSYDAYYDTDVTVPSIYFRPDIDRPADATRQSMDFTYLFHNSIDNPHFITMGTGQRIRSDVDPTGTSSAQKKINRKVKRAEPEVIEIASCERLARALSSRK